jgi:hypothetical protein
VGKPEGKRQFVGGKIIRESILENYGVKVWTGFIWLKIRASVGLL